MAQKKFKQFFAKDFIGIDGESSAIEEDLSGANRALNYEMSVSNSLRGRMGCQVSSTLSDYYGLFPYRFTRTQSDYSIVYDATTLGTSLINADGATVEKIVVAAQQLYVLDTMSIVVTRSSGTYPFTWYSYVNGSNINFCIKANGVSILDTSLGAGTSNSTSTSIWSLLGTIDALAELSVSRTTRGTCPPFAIVDGNQFGTSIGSCTYGNRWRITVDSGHNFAAGDIITIPYGNPRSYVSFPVIATTATTITYVGVAITVTDNDILGYMTLPATLFPIAPAESVSSGDLTLEFPYLRNIPPGDAGDILGTLTYGLPFQGASNEAALRTFVSSANYGTFFAPPTAENASGNLYIASSGTFSYGTENFNNNLLKFDNKTLVRAGLPAITVGATAIAGGALAGVYKYKAFLRRVDAQGNIVEGAPSDIATVTYGGGNDQGTITATPPLYSEKTGFQGRSCYKYGAESPAAGVAFAVDDNTAAPGLNAFIQPGDPIILMDSVAYKAGLTSVGQIHRTHCTFYDGTTTPSSIKVADSSGYTIPDNSPISTGLTVVVIRNTAGGSQFYELAEMPITGYAAYSFTDNVTDAVLTAGTQFIDAEIGKEHDPPPPCSLVCQHQGGLVVARGPTAPNTVSFSSYDGIEYFPVASNSFDVPSNQSGSITAIASDTDDRLAVFKDRAYYDVVGDLDGGTFSINVRNEGDFGAVSQNSLVRIRGALIGLSRNGFITVSNGVLSVEGFRPVNARIINQAYYFPWAVGVNDSFNQQYICSIPTATSPITFVIDYSKGILRFFERSYPDAINPSGGMATLGQYLYHLSSPINSVGLSNVLCRSLYRFNGDSPSGNGDGDSFIDNTSAISYILESSVINHGEPDILNTPIRARVWSIPNDYVVDGWVPHSILVEGGCSPLSANCGTGNNSTSSTITFAASSDLYKDVKLVSTKTHFYIIRFTTNTIRTAPFITGYEILYAESYDPEDLIK